MSTWLVWPITCIAACGLIWLCSWLFERYCVPARVMHNLKAWAQWVANVVAPLGVIAGELRRMNDLKEQEMAERLNPRTGERDPIYILKEQPGKNDTEVFFGTDETVSPGAEGMRQKSSKVWADDGNDD